ncbi:MAG: hypothetical protein VX278_21360 [Myxococcota bacterium]|nr:hypothetical protein [Myxococcota bacterium]
MNSLFLFQSRTEYHLKEVDSGIVLCHKDTILCSSVASRAPSDAYEYLQSANSNPIRIPIYADSEHQFLDAEGGIEFFRACSVYGHPIIPVAPLDYSVCWILKALGASQIEVEVSNPAFEIGITRPKLLSHILNRIDIPFIAGGVFSAQDKDKLWDMGFHAILNYKQESM